MAEKFLVSLSYILVILCSVGMILFAAKYPFSTRVEDPAHAKEEIAGLNGFQLWVASWSSIIAGTAIQLIHYWMSLSSKAELIIKF